ncbi:Ionotropic receptor 187, partial [Frankliniella occidentalis]
MEALLVAFLLCCAAPGARAGLPVVDSVAPPEARSAAALLTPFMSSQKATLVVRGTSCWTGAFLRKLSADIPRLLAPKPSSGFTALKQNNYSDTLHLDRLEHGLIATRLVHFVPTDDLQELLYAMRNYPEINKLTDARVLFWTTLVTVSAPQDRVLRHIIRLNKWLGLHQRTLALTFFNGSSILYNLTCTPTDDCWRMDATVFEMDRWSPVEHRWRLGAALFYEFCNGYRKIGKPQELTVFMEKTLGLTNTSSLMELAKSAVNLASQSRHRRMQSQTPVNYQQILRYEHVGLKIRECTLAALLSDDVFFTRHETVEVTFL